MKSLSEVYDGMAKAYGSQRWYADIGPFAMILGAVLIQNTTSEHVSQALHNFGDHLDAAYIAQCDDEELVRAIYPAGFYNQKKDRVREISKWFLKYNCDLAQIREKDPQKLRQELLSINGIGKETADTILLYALDFPFFIIDSYTKRIFERLGYPLGNEYDKIRLWVQENLPLDIVVYKEYHALLVEHAKQRCKKKPVCRGCAFYYSCKYREEHQP